MTRIILIYITVVAGSSLAVAAFVWWLTWRRNRREDRGRHHPVPGSGAVEAESAMEPEHAHGFAATELGYSLDGPEGAILLERLASERHATMENADRTHARQTNGA